MCARVMESDCRIPMSCLRPRILALHALFWGLVSLRVFGAALLSDEKAAVAVTKAMTAPCWQLEEFVVAKECSACEGFHSKSIPACSQTGFVETINCTKSNREEFKSCRSAKMEEHLFWKFEATMLALTVVFAIVVVVRQRSLDRQASDKVRRQIECI
ncbi:protein JTB isoform X1 [Rhinichthys klamathensis goyatoka]|uniref:protein JTB isoform X1 n=1 Tax=Rhinichthys klamathensis goyatoka TaxID=3034132 RepID=UPI0024B507A0|nr:protein JTB isoform X1 [Rhinichthys klamathensis goyatoka]XP_056105597.1 protein JTB isoform X1 [Rhinichthys klamathensis goyatoka]